VVLDQIVSNECTHVTEEDLGLDVPIAVEVSWDGDTLVLSGFGPEPDCEWDGDMGFTNEWTETMEVADPCYLGSDFEQDGTITSSTSFEVDGSITQYPDGDCSSAPVDVITCTIEVGYTGTKD